MELLDIIFLIITICIGYFLYSILGKRTGHEPTADTFATRETVEVKIVKSAREEEIAPPLITGFKQIKKLDPKFDQFIFLTTIRGTFESIINAFVKGDLEVLKKLLKPELYGVYAQAIADRNKERQHAELTFFRLIRAEIKDIQLKDFLASIRINFISEQTHLLKDSQGHLLEGNPNMVDEINEMWVFEKNMKTAGSPWVLAETHAN